MIVIVTIIIIIAIVCMCSHGGMTEGGCGCMWKSEHNLQGLVLSTVDFQARMQDVRLGCRHL